jgi:Holliday junction DNA helicase RuvA
VIDRLTGRIVRKSSASVVLDVRGIGFDLQVSTGTLESLSAVGTDVTMFVSLLWRNESLLLTGFSTEAEREIFSLLIGVSGVGPRIALALLSHLGTQGVLRALKENQAAAFARTPGVGKKLSERIALDLRDKVSHLELAGGPAMLQSTDRLASLGEDGVTALESLGFSRKEAEAAFSKVLRENESSDLPQAIRLALRELGSTK